MALQLENTANVGNSGIKVLAYGRSGAGKTRLAATAPKPIIISAESGLLSLQNMQLPYLTVKTLDEVFEAYKLVTSNVAPYNTFQTIIVDSISEIMEVLLAAEKKGNKDPRKAYGALADRGVELARAFRDIPNKNVIILAKEESWKDDNTGITTIQPSLPGSKLGPSLPYYFDEVFRVETGKDTTVVPHKDWTALRCKADQYSTAKDRSGKLNEYEPHDIGAIFNKILGR
jgi:hypothetical protein